jgi:hypothetical protein
MGSGSPITTFTLKASATTVYTNDEMVNAECFETANVHLLPPKKGGGFTLHMDMW